MQPSPGSRVGPYEIIALLGEGGMGQVYRARDAKLNRDVAIKILPELFASDPDRLARFEREAQVLASLNHPHIAHIYGIEGNALVMELVDGRDLSAIISGAGRVTSGSGARGASGGQAPTAERPAPTRALPVAEALAIARQIAEALEAAHEQGIIHRDLKPANVKVRDDGTVKLLDFGLAKALGPEGTSAPDAMNSPTLTARATQMGMVLGTAAYMSPEQARGKAVDRRADIWAFGAVLFEMLTGRRAFEGDDISITLAAVLKDDVPWSALPADLPQPVRRLLRRCLEKDPKQRLSAIGDARLELNDSSNPSLVDQPLTSGVAAVVHRERSLRASWPLIVAGTAAGILATAFVMWQWMRPVPASAVRRLSIMAPEGPGLFPDARESMISPIGTAVAFITGSPQSLETSHLWVRSLSDMRTRLIEGATGAHLPFWSPDGRRVGFFADGKLKTVALDSGRVDVVCDAPDGRGGTWNAAGVIVFAPSNAGPLMRVAVSGGEPQPATALDASRKETGHRFPFFLPDGRHFLFAALPAHSGQFDIFGGALDSTERPLVLTAATSAVYADPGFLLFARKGVLVAQPFDAKNLRLTGDAITLDDIPGATGFQFTSSSAVSASPDALVYVNDPFANTRLAWFTREGHEIEGIQADAGRYIEIRLAPDNQHAALVRQSSTTSTTIWVLDLARHGATRIADKPGANYQVAWSPDGKRLAYTSDGSGTENLFVRDAAGATPEMPLFESPALFKKVQSWAADGTVLFTQRTPDTGNDLMTVGAAGGRSAAPYLHETFSEDLGRFSPDGHWVAYVSDESGNPDVYVRSYPTPDHKYRVTTDGGTWAAWNGAGTQLLVGGADGRQIKLADVRPGAELSISVPKVVGLLPPDASAWDVSRDLQRLIVSVPAPGSVGLSLTVLENWRAELRKKH
jgi:serine/threonine protein kinase/Tol biopolymer transport system component